MFPHPMQTFAEGGRGANICTPYADQRIGEILRELPKGKGNQYQQSAEVSTPTKREAEKQANLDHHIAIDLQKMAANPEVVEAVVSLFFLRSRRKSGEEKRGVFRPMWCKMWCKCVV